MFSLKKNKISEKAVEISVGKADNVVRLEGYDRLKDNVIYMNTFSLTVSPAFRVGYMVLPTSLVSTFEEKLGFYSCTVPTFEQLVLTELINRGDFERHVNSVRRLKRAQIKQ